MRVVFMGTPAIAATCLRELIESNFEIVGVYTKPDMPKNRGMKLEMSEVKQLALAQGLAVYQPTSFKEEQTLETLRALRPDVIAVVAYGKLLPQDVLDLPRFGCVNIHASILPQLRGSAPVQWAILNGCRQTGVSAMYMSAQMDAGDIIEVRTTPIDPEENSAQLMDRLAQLGAPLLRDTLFALELGEVTRTAQDPEKVTYAPMLTKALSPIDFTRSAREICNQIHGLDPWPVATTEIGGKRLKIYGAHCAEKTSEQPAGTLLALHKEGLDIACGNHTVLTVTCLQAEGGRKMAATDYFRGHPIEL